MLPAKARQSSSTGKTTASVRSSIQSLQTCRIGAFSLWPGRQAAVDNGTQAVHLRENFRPLARKRNFRGRRGKATWWVTFSWDNASITRQSQRSQLKLSIEWDTRNGIILGVWSILKNACGLGREDSSIYSLSSPQKQTLQLSQKRRGGEHMLGWKGCSESPIPYWEMLTLLNRLPWCS